MVPKYLKKPIALMRKNLIALIGMVDYRIMLMILGLTVGFWLLIWSGLFQPKKAILETAAVVVTALFTSGLLMRFASTRHVFFLWGPDSWSWQCAAKSTSRVPMKRF